MSQGSTLHRFKITLSDIERSVYQTLDFRVAMHSSETPLFLVTRVLAYILNFESGLEFSQGLATPDEPSIRLLDSNGTIVKWIDIGSPTARRLHKASKAAKSVRVYTYRDPEIMQKEVEGQQVHRAEEIEIFSVDPKFLDQVAEVLARDNAWTVLYNEGELTVAKEDLTWVSQLGIHRLGK